MFGALTELFGVSELEIITGMAFGIGNCMGLIEIKSQLLYQLSYRANRNFHQPFYPLSDLRLIATLRHARRTMYW